MTRQFSQAFCAWKLRISAIQEKAEVGRILPTKHQLVQKQRVTVQNLNISPF
jgi:hypothetical protein